MAFYKFLAERSMFMENFEGFCFWTSLEENQIFLLFVFPGMIYPPETDVIYRQLIYNQLTATTQHIPWLNLLISMGFFILISAFPAIFALNLQKRHTWAPEYRLIPTHPKQSLLTIIWNKHIFNDDGVATLERRVGVLLKLLVIALEGSGDTRLQQEVLFNICTKDKSLYTPFLWLLQDQYGFSPNLKGRIELTEIVLQVTNSSS